MEEEQSNLFEQNFTQSQLIQLLRLSKWLRTITIIGFGLGGSIVFSMLFNGKQVVEQMVALFPVKMPGLYTAFILVFFIFFFIIAAMLYFLSIASGSIGAGVLQKSETHVAKGFQALKNFFLILVIFSVLGLIGNFLTLFIK